VRNAKEERKMSAVIVKRQLWSDRVKEIMDYLKKKDYKKGDRLVKVGDLKELFNILGTSMAGWIQWLDSPIMEEFTEDKLTLLCNELRDNILPFLATDHVWTKDMEDKKAKQREKACKECGTCTETTPANKQYYVA